MAASKKSPYCALAEALKKGDYDVTNSNFSFPLIEVEEASEADSEVIRLEDEQWKKDDLLIHPPEAVILQMEDDDEPAEETGADGSGKKEKGFHFSFRHHKSKENGGSSSDIDEHTSVQETSLSKDDSSLSANETEVSAVKEERGEDSKTEKTSDTAVSLAESMPDTKENVSSYIESVMQSVADIEASVAEELKHPIRYDTTVRRESSSGGTDTDTSTEYQSKLNEVEGDLSPKERLEKLMKLIEEDRKAEEQKTPDIYQEEELDMDEFLMNLVGASAITDAMVKNYHAEQDQDT